MRVTQVWGIDQTGASVGKMKAKALPAAFLQRDGKNLFLQHNLTLESLSPHYLHKRGWNEEIKSLLFLDSVLGLPNEVSTRFSVEVFAKAATHLHEIQKYGALTAHSFFQNLLTKAQQKKIPTRMAEIQAKANSVFKLQPYQRNIGCGTFRIWSDLGSHPNWFQLWNQPEEATARHILIEAYPSLLWKKRIHSKRGNEAALRAWLRSHHIQIRNEKFQTGDHMDAAVLAACGYLHQSLLKRKIPLEPTVAAQEGWIFDLDMTD